MDKPFYHLHVHSHYSLLNALPKIKELVKNAKENDMDAVALTDNGNLYGAIEFYKTCKDAGIKPIIGIDGYLAIRSRKDKEARIDNRRTRLLLLAKSHLGYKNIIKLVTESHLEGFYYKPRLDKEIIERWHEDIICISPFFNSEISNALKGDDAIRAKEICKYYEDLYGKDNFYLEITHHPEIEGALDLKNKLISFAKESGYNLVASHDVYYIKKEDRDARKTLMSVQQSFGNDSYFQEDEDFSFIDKKTANQYFKDVPQALENTKKIVDACNLEIPLGVWKFPELDIENGNTPDEELRRLAYKGLERRKLELTDKVKTRIEYELEIIKNKGYSKYFLTVGDLLRFAKENKIQSNTRGSAAGSLISYLIGITIVDPLAMRLPFERFLNPERPSAPDIDMDFADNRRDEVIEYARQKYGKDHVAQIGTFGTMLARGSVRDTARAMGFDYDQGDKISKLIPMGAQGFPMTIDRALKEEDELKKLYKSDADSKIIIDMARKIEGCARHIGVHAAGVVISPDPLVEDVPLQNDPKGEGKLITQYDMHAVGEDGVGLLKFDFLGLKNLTIMANTIRLIEKVYGEDVDIDDVPIDDKKTYEMLARGETAATFQLNGSGMTRFLKDLRPSNIDDINAMVALYRPGPLAFIPDYIERKHNPSKVKYIDDRFEEILGPTYGILIYQDDVMLLAVNFAGYSWLEADKLRKAMGKKIPEVMAEQYGKFTKGCMEIGGLTEKQTKDLWDSIETFAAYGFNKAHAASYGRIAYLTSYLKANYPVLYMASVLTADQGDVDKVAEMVNECKRMEIEVLPPDINESFEDFASVGKESKIRFGLTTIKNFGEGIANAVVEERKLNGPYTSLEDFLTRLKDKSLNKRSLESLMASGALDRFGERGQMLSNLEAIIGYKKEISNGPKNQTSLFGISETPSLRLEPAPPITDEQRLAWEKELLGLYVSGNPLDKFKTKLEQKTAPISSIIEKPLEGSNTLIGGIISDVRIIKTKKGHDMAFIKVSDYDNSIEVVVFPKIIEKYRDLIEVDTCLVIKGKVSARNGEVSIIMEQGKRLISAN